MYNKTLCCHNYYCLRSAVLFWHFSRAFFCLCYMKGFSLSLHLNWQREALTGKFSCVTPKALFCLCNIEKLSSFFFPLSFYFSCFIDHNMYVRMEGKHERCGEQKRDREREYIHVCMYVCRYVKEVWCDEI